MTWDEFMLTALAVMLVVAYWRYRNDPDGGWPIW